MERSGSPIVSGNILAAQLNTKLPIHVSASDVDSHPQLATLLEDISLKLASSGTDIQAQNTFNHSTLLMKQARQRYLEEETLLYFISDIVANKSNISSDKVMDELSQALSMSELQSCTDILSLSSNNESSENQENYLLNLSPDDITSTVDDIMTDKHRKFLLNKLDEVLIDHWNRIYQFLHPGDIVTDVTQKVEQITEEVQKLQKEIITETQKLKSTRSKNDILFYQVYTQLMEYGQLLLSLVEGPRMSEQPLLSLSNLYVTNQAQYLKLKCMESEILCKTYNSKTVPALKSIHSNLSERHKIATQMLTQLKHKLSSYNSLDPKYVKLIEEYSKLCQDIEFCQMTR